MPVEDCQRLVNRALDRLIGQLNGEQFGEINEATLQHHLALNMHLDAIFGERLNLDMTLEKKVRRAEGLFPKKDSKTASIDLFFQLEDCGARCAIEMKCFHRVNHREPNNRYDAYADIANLEVYLEEHADVGALVVVTDHPHYFDVGFRAHTQKTGDFSLREGHHYDAGRVLSYRTDDPHGPDIVLRQSYEFRWRNLGNKWRVLILDVKG
jgi:hypothetical protein